MGDESFVTNQGKPVFKVTRPFITRDRMLEVDDGMFEIPDSVNDPMGERCHYRVLAYEYGIYANDFHAR